MNTIKLPALALTALTLLLTAGCNAAKKEEELFTRIDATPHVNAINQAQQDWAWITGTQWIATSIESNPPIQGSNLWIKFEDHTWLTGSAGCNRLTGSYNRIGIDGLKITQLAATRKYCPDPQGIMQQESRFLHLLEQCDSYTAEPNQLILQSNGINMLTFTRAEP